MINLNNILLPESVICNSTEISTKKQVLETISRLAHQIDPGIKDKAILESLQQRERLGSTVMGHGIAIPHGRIPNLEQPICVLITLDKAIEFEPTDTVAIDIIFGLLVPKDADETHLEILSHLAEKLKSKEYRETLRNANTNETLYQAAISE